MRGVALLIAEVIEALELPPVVLVANDWGGPQITAADRPELIAGLVLTPEEAFDNYPPGSRCVRRASCRLPGGLSVAARSLRVPGFQRLPMTFGRMTKRPIPGEILRGWTEGLLTKPGVRAMSAETSRPPPRAASRRPPTTRRSTGPPPSSGPPTTARCREVTARPGRPHPAATLVEVDDCSVLMPLDQPTRIAEEIRAFAAST